MRAGRAAGFSLVEALVSLAVLSIAATALTTLLIENSKINRAQQAQARVQSDARTTLALFTQKLRLAGWDPSGAGIGVVTLDPDPGDSIDTIDLFADLNADGDTADSGEAVTIRHVGDQVEWRESASAPYEIVAVGITNDADGDGTPEPMFVPDVTPDPTRLTVRITAESDTRDPHTGEPIRFTISSDVFLRNR